MQQGEFFTRVRLRSGLESAEEACLVTSTVLGVFGTLDLGGQLRNVVAQLPREVAPMLLARDATESFSASEFVASVAAELDWEASAAETAAAAVLITLRESLTEGVFLGVHAVLPADYRRFMTPKRAATI